MLKVETTVMINRPNAEVFDYMANAENDVQWQAGVLESKKTSQGPMGVGTIEESETQIMGRRIKSTIEVTEFEPHRKIKYKTTSGPIPFEASYMLEPVSADNTKVTMLAEAEAGGFFKLAEPVLGRMLQRQWETNFSTLKDLLESQA